MTKKHLSRMISFVLVFALLFSLFPGSVFAQNSNSVSAGVNAFLPKEGETPVYREENVDAEVAEELIEGRGEFRKEFLLENGQKLLALFPRAVHFEENGEWKEIDNTLKPSDIRGNAVYTNTAGIWEVRLPQTLSKNSFVEVSYDGYTLGFGFAGEDGDLLTLAVLQHMSGDGSTLNIGGANLQLRIVVQSDHLVEGDGVFLSSIQLFNEQSVAILNLVLLAAGFNDCVHRRTYLFYRLAAQGGFAPLVCCKIQRPLHAATAILAQVTAAVNCFLFIFIYKSKIFHKISLLV